MRKKAETWEDVSLQVKNARVVFAKQPVRHLKRTGGSRTLPLIFAQAYTNP
jgi:CRISPR/Cas system CSM-associated protein Csm2 small subunit